jgi:hypothetical protein
MDWVLDNIRLIVIVGGAIAYWLNQRRKAKEEQQIKEVLSTPLPKVQISDDAERTRRIQEEIRRKILERTGGGARPQIPLVPRVETPPPLIARPQKDETAYSQPSVEAQVINDEAVLEQQQLLAAKLRELEQIRRQHLSRAETFAEKTSEAMDASKNAVRGSLLADLRKPTSVRRAIVLREVLGTPVGLR